MTIPIVIVGPDLRIRRFTGMANRVLNVVPTDVGRSILDIRWKIELEDVERVLLGVIGGGDFDGDLRDAERKKAAGFTAYKIKVVRKNGDVSFVYLDPDAFLEIRVLTQRVEHGAQIEEEKDLGDYEKVNGVYFPLSIETGAKGDQEKAKITFDKAEANVPLDDAMFRFPAKS